MVDKRTHIHTGYGRQYPVFRPTVDYALHPALKELVRYNYAFRDNNFSGEGEQLLRLSTSAYSDGLNELSGNTRPSARFISNAIFHQSESTKIFNTKNCTDMFWLWGQIVDHDLDLTTAGGSNINIAVPTGDVYFDPMSVGNVEISMTRSIYDPSTGISTPREQLNLITPELDCTSIYGSTATRASWLRLYKDGLLKSGMGYMLPMNDGTMDNAGDAGTNVYVSGDVRANENVALLSMHTLLFRNHNWWAKKIKLYSPSMSDEEIYQRARMMNEFEVQSITYNEFLPLLLGDGAIPEYTGYDEGVNNQIANEFSSIAYRLGHSLISEELLRLKGDGTSIGSLSLREAFFAPHHYCNDGDIEYILRGFCKQKCQKIDAKIVNSLRNFLFGEPGSGGLDLVSLNIQRGRDHGFSDYNSMRVDLGLGAKVSFSDITSDVSVSTALSTAYGGDISIIDPWVGGLCEDPINDSQLGELFHYIVRDQFIRTRDGDEYWYELRCTPKIKELLALTTLSTLLKRNAGIRDIKEHAMKI